MLKILLACMAFWFVAHGCAAIINALIRARRADQTQDRKRINRPVGRMFIGV